MEYIQLQNPDRSSRRSGGLDAVGDTLEAVVTWSVEHAVVIGLIAAGVVAAVVLWRLMTRGGASRL